MFNNCNYTNARDSLSLFFHGIGGFFSCCWVWRSGKREGNWKGEGERDGRRKGRGRVRDRDRGMRRKEERNRA
jgi:hypothetical protein